jgi:hypothetical protein
MWIALELPTADVWLVSHGSAIAAPVDVSGTMCAQSNPEVDVGRDVAELLGAILDWNVPE